LALAGHRHEDAEDGGGNGRSSRENRKFDPNAHGDPQNGVNGAPEWWGEQISLYALSVKAESSWCRSPRVCLIARRCAQKGGS
jgi:hypothetical protein